MHSAPKTFSCSWQEVIPVCGLMNRHLPTDLLHRLYPHEPPAPCKRRRRCRPWRLLRPFILDHDRFLRFGHTAILVKLYGLGVPSFSTPVGLIGGPIRRPFTLVKEQVLGFGDDTARGDVSTQSYHQMRIFHVHLDSQSNCVAGTLLEGIGWGYPFYIAVWAMQCCLFVSNDLDKDTSPSFHLKCSLPFQW